MINVLFMGRKQVACDCLDYLLNNSEFNVVGVLTDSHLENSVTADLAISNGLKLYDYESCLNDLKTGKLNFDLGLSMLYWRKLKDEFINMPHYGVINFHPAILPDYKGTAGYNLAILDGLNEWGVSAHYVDSEIDTGEIIEVDFFGMSPSETVVSLEKKSQLKLYNQFVRILDKFLQNVCARLPTTPNIGGRYISRSEMEAMKVIRPDDDIDRKIRAFWFPPYDGAYIEINGHKYTLVSSEILQGLAPANSSSLFTKPRDTDD